VPNGRPREFTSSPRDRVVDLRADAVSRESQL
jgi:hypothetical protein